MKDDKSKIYFTFLLLLFLAILGFWNTYFGRVFFAPDNIDFYTHFHACIALIWMTILAAQALLMANRENNWHRILGRASYFVFPLLCLSIVLLAHHRISRIPSESAKLLFIPFKDLIALLIVYGIALVAGKYTIWHAQGMMATGIVFIEPALVRAIDFTTNGWRGSYPATIVVIYSLLSFLSVMRWRRDRQISIYPFLLIYFVITHSIIVFNLRLQLWQSLANWFLSIPITK